MKIEGLQDVCARDTKKLDDVRAGARAASQKLRSLTPAQRAVLVQKLAAKQQDARGGGGSARALARSVTAEAAQLEIRASAYHAAPLNGYDDEDGGDGGMPEDGSTPGGGRSDRMSRSAKNMRQSTALEPGGRDRAGSGAVPMQPLQADVEELVLFEVDATSMEDVLRALQVCVNFQTYSLQSLLFFCCCRCAS